MASDRTETDAALVAALSELHVVAITLFGEARSEPIEGKIAIASVMRNRVIAHRKAWGYTLREVCLAPYQFSCWASAGGTENYQRVMDAVRLVSSLGESPSWVTLRECIWIAEGLVGAKFRSNVGASDHYLTTRLYKNDPPTWAKGVVPVAVIGNHTFLVAA